jgi:hypothetical protein
MGRTKSQVSESTVRNRCFELDGNVVLDVVLEKNERQYSS